MLLKYFGIILCSLVIAGCVTHLYVRYVNRQGELSIKL